MRTLYEVLSSSNVDDSKFNIIVIVKPGFFKDIPLIINKFTDKGWVIERTKTKQLLPEEAEKLYEVHKDEEWFDELIEYMTSEPTTAILFTKDSEMEKDMFDETNGIKDEIRSEIGESEMRNGVHTSDSLERLQIERGIYF